MSRCGPPGSAGAPPRCTSPPSPPRRVGGSTVSPWTNWQRAGIARAGGRPVHAPVERPAGRGPRRQSGPAPDRRHGLRGPRSGRQPPGRRRHGSSSHGAVGLLLDPSVVAGHRRLAGLPADRPALHGHQRRAPGDPGAGVPARARAPDGNRRRARPDRAGAGRPGTAVRRRRRRAALGLRPRRLPHPRPAGRRSRCRFAGRRRPRCRSVPSSSSRSATRPPRARTCRSSSPATRRRGLSCSPATGGGPRCSAMPPRRRHRSRAARRRRSRGCSAPARSDRSRAATRSTASRLRSRCSHD